MFCFAQDWVGLIICVDTLHANAKYVLLEYNSKVRLKACCAADVMESTSSRIMIYCTSSFARVWVLVVSPAMKTHVRDVSVSRDLMSIDSHTLTTYLSPLEVCIGLDLSYFHPGQWHRDKGKFLCCQQRHQLFGGGTAEPKDIGTCLFPKMQLTMMMEPSFYQPRWYS